jgi:hypothetical protein
MIAKQQTCGGKKELEQGHCSVCEEGVDACSLRAVKVNMQYVGKIKSLHVQ